MRYEVHMSSLYVKYWQEDKMTFLEKLDSYESEKMKELLETGHFDITEKKEILLFVLHTNDKAVVKTAKSLLASLKRLRLICDDNWIKTASKKSKIGFIAAEKESDNG